MTSPILPADHRAVLDIVIREGRVDLLALTRELGLPVHQVKAITRKLREGGHLREQKVRYYLPRRSA